MLNQSRFHGIAYRVSSRNFCLGGEVEQGGGGHTFIFCVENNLANCVKF